MRNANSLSNQRLHSRRSGTAATECALIVPVMVIILLGAIDIGQYINVAQSVSNASREGARIACRGSTGKVSMVRSSVVEYLAQTYPNVEESVWNECVTVTVKDESTGYNISEDLTTCESGAPMSVLVKMDFHEVRWLKGIAFWGEQYKETTTYTRRE